MFAPLSPAGAIRDLGAGATWNQAAIEVETARRARSLSQFHVGAGDVVAIVHGGGANFFFDLFAVWRIGAVAACLDPGLSENERERVIAFCDAKVALGEKPTASEIAGRPLLDLAADAHAPAPDDSSFGRAPRLDSPAIILFTSGTTGAPKGVVLSHRALIARTALNAAAIGRDVLARTLVTLPTHFGHGLIGNALTPLFAGGTIILHPRGLALAQHLGALIDEHEISFLSSVPSLWRLALKLGRPSARHRATRIHVGSAPLSAELWRDIAAWSGAEVVNCYGITETANWVGGASSVHDGIKDGLVGRTWGGSYAVLRDDGAIAAEGEGEVLVQTPSAMSGYLARQDLTDAAMMGAWYRTGDRGHLDAHGCLCLTGRLKDEINRAGMKVQPAELDMLLERHPAVAEACAFGVADAVSGEVVAIAVRLKPGSAETAASLRAWTLERFRRDATPERWYFVDDIPRTSRGKVSRDAVRAALIGAPKP